MSDSFRLATSARTLNITGDLIVNGGKFDLSAGNVVGTVNLTGDFYLTAGTITETSGGSGLIVFNNSNGIQNYTYTGGSISGVINFTVSNTVTLQMDSEGYLEGGGTCTLSSGATLGVTSADGISTSGSTGNVRTAGRVFSRLQPYL